MSARKRHAILHIGTGKTGTTSIQSRLKQAGEELLGRGYYYPETWGPRHHGQLARIMSPRSRAAADAAVASLSNELAQLPESVHTVAFSSELMYGQSLVPGSVARLKEALDPYFDSFKLVVYLRRQDEMAVSGYSTLIKGGRIFEDPFDMGEARLRVFDYAANLEPWSEAFGRDAIVARVFDRTEFAGGDVVTDFLHAVGIGALATKAENPEANPSLDAAALEFLRRINAAASGTRDVFETADGNAKQAHTPRTTRLPKLLVEEFPGKGMLPAREQAVAFYERFRQTNAEVLARYFPRRAQLFREDFSRYPDVPEKPSETAMLDVAVRVVLVLLRQLDRYSAADHVRQARKARETGDTANARELYLTALAEGGGKAALDELASLTPDPVEAERLLHRIRSMGPSQQTIRRVESALFPKRVAKYRTA